MLKDYFESVFTILSLSTDKSPPYAYRLWATMLTFMMKEISQIGGTPVQEHTLKIITN